MNDRVREFRQESFLAKPSVSRNARDLDGCLQTAGMARSRFPFCRATAFKGALRAQNNLSRSAEKIVGERGPKPKACPTYPELTCHSLEDLEILRTRP